MPGGRPKKPPDEKARVASFKLPPDLIAHLRARSKEQRISQAAIVIAALRAYFKAPAPPAP